MAIPAITNNSPSAGYIAWAAFTIQLYGVAYSVPAGSSNQRWIWWEFRAGVPILNAGPDVPDTLTDDDLVLFANKNGIGVRVQSTSFIDGELLVDGSIFSAALSANLINSEHIVTEGLDAGVIKFGTMSGERIEAESITGDKIMANSISSTELNSEAITTDLLLSNDVLAQALQAAGARIGGGVWDSTQFDLPGALHVDLATGEASFVGDVTAKSLSSSLIRMLGSANTVEGALKLSNGVVAPSIPPVVQWSTQARTLALATDTPNYKLQGLYNDDVTESWVSCWWAVGASIGGSIQSFRKDTGARTDLAYFGGGANYGNDVPGCGVVKLGNYWYVLVFRAYSSTAYYLLKYDLSWNLISRRAMTFAGLTAGLVLMTSDGTSLYALWCSNGSLRVGDITTAPSPSTLFSISGWGEFGASDAYIGNADFGEKVIVVSSAETNTTVRVWTWLTAIRRTSYEWNPTYGLTRGVSWDGTRFSALSTAGNVYNLSKFKASTSVQATYTWYDSDVAGTGQHESTPSPITTYTIPARQWITILTGTPADNGGTDDPDSVRVYLNNHRQATLAPLETVYVTDDVDTAGVVAPASNGFLTSNVAPAKLTSTASDLLGEIINLLGDGSGRVGPLAWDVNGETIQPLSVKRLRAYSTTDATNTVYTAGNEPPFISGDPAGVHIRMDGNELIAMLTAATQGALYLNQGGGGVVLGGGQAVKGIRCDSTSVSFNSSGVGTMAHGLGRTPAMVIASSANESVLIVASAWTSTNVTFNARFAGTATWTASSRIVNWIAVG